MSPRLLAPTPIADEHDLDAFDCGAPPLNDWLRRRARTNQAGGATRTFVVCEARRVVAYYALASGAIDAGATPGRFRRNMPDPIPVAVLARLAVDRTCHGQVLARGLIGDASRRLVQAADAIGIRGMVVHALSDDARAFYIAVGFDPSPRDPLTLMITLTDLRALLH